MKETGTDVTGKVFVVVGSLRRCLICEHTFTPNQAAEHAATACEPRTKTPHSVIP
jgi:hypothetical protein